MPQAVTERVRLARLALAAATATPGVVEPDAGQLVTSDPPHDLRGIRVTALADGRYEIELRLIAELVPLHQLATDVRDAISAAARIAGFESRIASVTVAFADVVERMTPVPALGGGRS